MYIPLEATLLRWLQLPLQAWLPPDGPGSRSMLVPEAQLRGHHHGHEWLKLGNISPYHGAPAIPGVSADLPDDCTVDQVILLHRHGSRGPAGEQGNIIRLAHTLEKARDIIQAADLPPALEFLKQGYEYRLDPEELTVIGRRELFDHGVRFFLRYPTFETDTVVSTTVQRVIDSAHFFAQGFFGRKADNVTFLTTADVPGPVSWLTPWESCPAISYVEPYQTAQKWARKYIPPIVDRLNGLVPGVGFTFEDVQGALYACPYDLAARDRSPWCKVFTPREWRGLEYEIDLFFDGFTGHLSRGDPGPLAGAFYVQKLVERLTNVTKDARPLYLDFAHDFSILLAMSAMNLNKDTNPLSPAHPEPHRKFRTSYQTPFAAQMTWERFTCQTSFEGPQVRLVLNDATFPLSICEETERDREYGTCSLASFVHANTHNMGVEYHSAVWNATCDATSRG